MSRDIDYLTRFRWLLSLVLVGGSGLISYASTRMAYVRFGDDGIISLGNCLNVIGVAMVLSSLSVQSGLTRRLMLLDVDTYSSLKASLFTLYSLGVVAGLSYFFFSSIEITPIILMATVLYFPLSIANATFVAFGKQTLNSFVLMLVSMSSLLAVYFASHPKELLGLIVSFQIIFILAAIAPGAYVYHRHVATKFAHRSAGRFNFVENARSQLELLRFSFYSVSSGFQSNQSMLAARLFLVAVVGTEFAGEMEMYQRPLSWLFALASSMSGMFFYPFVVKLLKEQKSELIQRQVRRKIIVNVIRLSCSFVILASCFFPFLYWMTFGFSADISAFFAMFWIVVFTLRFVGVLMSAILLATNNVGSAVIAETILYLPLILCFVVFKSYVSSTIDPVYLYLAVTFATSMAYVFYFIYALSKNSVFYRELFS